MKSIIGVSPKTNCMCNDACDSHGVVVASFHSQTTPSLHYHHQRNLNKLEKGEDVVSDTGQELVEVQPTLQTGPTEQEPPSRKDVSALTGDVVTLLIEFDLIWFDLTWLLAVLSHCSIFHIEVTGKGPTNIRSQGHCDQFYLSSIGWMIFLFLCWFFFSMREMIMMVIMVFCDTGWSRYWESRIFGCLQYDGD